MLKTKKMKESLNIQIMMLSAALMLGLNYLVLSSFDLLSALTYLVVALLFGLALGSNKKSTHSFLLYGVLLSLIYNLGFSVIGLFEASNMFMVLAAIQQALLAFVSAEITRGGK